jgi:hypothetical protein
VAAPSIASTRAELFQSLQHVCALPKPPPDAPDTRREVFAELALLEGPVATLAAARLEDLPALAADPHLRLLAAPHLVAKLGTRADVTLVDRIGATQEASLYRLDIAPRETSEGGVVLELDVTLQLPNPNGTIPAPTATTTMTTTGHEQQLMLLSAPLPHTKARSLLALVKYWRIRDQQDMRAIFECKMRERQNAISRQH